MENERWKCSLVHKHQVVIWVKLNRLMKLHSNNSEFEIAELTKLSREEGIQL